MANPVSIQPPEHIERITPNDSTDISGGFRAINVATSGLVYVDAKGMGSNVPVYVSAGGWFALVGTRIYDTGTTASGITVAR